MQLNIVRITDDMAIEEGGYFVILPGTIEQALMAMRNMAFPASTEQEAQDAFFVPFFWDTEEPITTQLLSIEDAWADRTPTKAELADRGTIYVTRREKEKHD